MQAASAIRREAFRRTRRVAIGVGLAGLLTFIAATPGNAAPDAAAQADFNRGRGSASAFGIKVNPVVGGLSFGVTTGLAIAGHQNTGAQGQAQAVDLGTIGLALAGEGCEGADPTLPSEQQPQPIVARTGDEGAEAGYGSSGDDLDDAIATRFVQADATPFARAVTTVAPFGLDGFLTVSGAVTTATSGIVDGNTREARAVSEVGGISIAGGLIELRGMRWEALHRSGAVSETLGTFTIDGVFIGGQQIPLPAAPDELVSALDELLRPLGLTVRLPETRVVDGVVFVDPLVVGIIPSDAREDLVGTILDESNPIGSLFNQLRTGIADLLIDADCGELGLALRELTGGSGLPGNTLVTVLDIAILTTLGGGSNRVELGGVQASTAEIDAFAFPVSELPDLPPELPDPPAVVDEVASPAPAPPADPTPPRPAPPAADETASAPPEQQVEQIQQIADISGSRGGWLALVGGVGLGLLLLAAEGDRRKMRAAMRVATAGAAAATAGGSA